MKRHLALAAALGATLAGCAPSPRAPTSARPYYPPPAPPPPVAPAPGASSAPKAPRDRDKVAVLPLDEDHLFRSERAQLRQLLASEIAKRAPDLDVLPLSQVDEKLRQVSKTNGKRCAYPAPALRGAKDHNWLASDLVHVAGYRNQPPELWVMLERRTGDDITFTGSWNEKLDLVTRFRSAFASLVRQPVGGGLGLLGGILENQPRKNQIKADGLTLCESVSFAECAPETQQLASNAKALASCFAGKDEDQQKLLFEGPARCELAGLDDTSGPGGRLESCLCHALTSSPLARTSNRRRTLDLDYEAPDLAGKRRPELRVIQTTDNLFADAGWRRVQHQDHGKTKYTSVRRLVVDNIDGLQAPLSRCTLPAGSIVVADLALGGDGHVQSAKLQSHLKKKAASSCIEKALSRGAFNCTDDGKPASLRIAISWPAGK